MTTPRYAPTRRGLLIAAATGVGTALCGCDVRLESGAPHLPGVPTGTASGPADGPLLRDEVGRLWALASAAHRVRSGSWPPRLARLHASQATRISRVLTGSGQTAPRSPAPRAAAPVPARDLAALEAAGADPAALRSLASAVAGNRPMLTAVHAVQVAAAILLKREVPWPGTPASAGAPAALGLLPAVRVAVYAAEEVAARTPQKDRDRVRATLARLYPLRSQLFQAAGGQAAPDPTGYRLPVTPDTAAGRERLMRLILQRLVTASAHRSATLIGVGDAGAVVLCWGTACAESWTWGVAPTAFPGLHT